MPERFAPTQPGKAALRISREATKHDRSLIRWLLDLRPEERLAVLQDFVDTFWIPRHG